MGGVAFIRGRGIRLYFKQGYNVVRRHQRADEPDDEKDLFEYLGSSKVKATANTLAKKFSGSVEIIKHKE